MTNRILSIATSALILLAAEVAFAETENTAAIATTSTPDIQLPTASEINKSVEEQKSVFENAEISVKPLLATSQNEFSEGPVQKHTIENKYTNLPPIFIIGDDKHSIEWAKTNAVYFKNIHAIGIIAHAASGESIKDVEEKIGMQLLTANLSGISKLIGTTHYPVLIYKNWVLQ